MTHLVKSILLFALALIILSCSDSDTVSNNNTNNEVNVEYGQYYPTKTGTWWEYERTIHGQTQQARFTVVGTQMINGKEWVKIESNADTTKSYIRYEDGKYYQYMPRSMTQFTQDLEFMYMDENASPGDSWEIKTVLEPNTPGYPAQVEAPYEITYVEKLESMEVRGNTYENVMAMNLHLSFVFNMGGDDIEIDYIDQTYYHAPGVGIIKAEIQGMMIQELLDYEI